jgi:cytochrome c oxidase cbb3-type subunit 2
MACPHLKDPQSVVPESIMPSYAFLATTAVEGGHNITADLEANALVGVPYTEEMVENAEADWWHRPIPTRTVRAVEGALSRRPSW